MKCVLVWLAVMTTTFHTSLAQCGRHGDIIVRGVNTPNLIAGYIDICSGTTWRAVCDDGWESTRAYSLCRQLGFTTSLHCTDSCFGRSTQTTGARDIWCSQGTCWWSDTSACARNAGIVCSNGVTIDYPLPCTTPTRPTAQCSNCPMAQCSNCPTAQCSDCPTPATCPTTENIVVATTDPAVTTRAIPTEAQNTTCPCPTTNSTDMMVGGAQESESCPSQAALGGGLGGLCAILAILLVGVVIWSCQRRSGKQERPPISHIDADDRNIHNPTYSPTSPNTIPSVQYSSLGPRGTSSTHHHPPSTGTYDVIDMPSAPYQPQARSYEVPISTIPAPTQPAEYSTLQHK